MHKKHGSMLKEDAMLEYVKIVENIFPYRFDDLECFVYYIQYISYFIYDLYHMNHIRPYDM